MLDFVVSFVILHLNSTESMTEEQFIKLSQKEKVLKSNIKLVQNRSQNLCTRQYAHF